MTGSSRRRISRICRSRCEPHLKIEIGRKQQLLQPFEFAEQLLLLDQRFAQAGLLELLLNFLHLVQDQFFAGEFQPHHQPRRILGLERLERLAQAETSAVRARPSRP